MLYTTLADLSRQLTAKKLSSVDLTRFFLDRIARLDAKLNSFITVTEAYALKAAEAADKARSAGRAGPLTGLPIAHKDIFCTQGVTTSCGSKMLANFIPPYDATLIERLNAAGMVMLGKTNMDEFAMGSSNETSFFGPVKNPWDTSRVPGGSSGGSAAAVAAYLAPAATATDTGGSIRQPAALSGICGLKPTYGRISRYGLVAFASSLDQAGPMARSAEDLALLLNAMAGFDERDSTSHPGPIEDYTKMLNHSLEGVRIGLPREYFAAGLAPAIEHAIQAAAKEYEKLGAILVDIDLAHTALAIPVYYVIAPAECSSNLARYDGVRYGHRCANPRDLTDLYQRSRSEGFGPEVKRRIMIGTYVLSAGYYDAYYLKAQKIRRLVKDDFTAAFKEVDLILGPTTPTTAFKLGEKVSDPMTMYLSDSYTITANLAGLPALSIPAGFSQGLPIGMQLIGDYFKESLLLNAAHRYQAVTNWHQQHPEDF